MSRSLRADFNGLFGDLLCLSHSESAVNEDGVTVELREGQPATAFEPDSDDSDQLEDLVASGVVERAPDWLRCNGSRWVLRIDDRGVRHESMVIAGQTQ